MWPQCGAGRARETDSLSQRSVPGSAKSGQKLPLSYTLASFLFAPGWLTKTGVAPYIEIVGRAAAWRDGASAKPLTVHTVTEHPAMLSWPCSRRCVECAGFCCLRLGVAGTNGTTGLQSSGLFDK
jgi:hypothetical protein